MKKNFKNLTEIGGVDLHCHTNISDGKYSLSELLDMACERGLDAIAVTDHNMMHSNIETMQQVYIQKGLRVIKGAEISALYETAGKSIEVHVVALNVDEKDLQDIFQNYLHGRRDYTEAMLRMLREKDIIDISYEEMQTRFQNNYLGKKHVAQMLTEKQVTKSVAEALERYVGSLGERICFAYSKDYIKLPELKTVVQRILAAGGVPILAHLHYYTALTEGEKEELVRYFKEAAGEKAAMEVYYYDYDEEQTAELERLAEVYGLRVSAGSDYHGWNEGEEIMKFAVRVEELLGEKT